MVGPAAAHAPLDTTHTEDLNSMSLPAVSRRRFLHGLTGAAAVAPFASQALWAQDRRIRHASFGAAGMALSDIRGFSKHPAFDLVAVADSDLSRTRQVKEMYPNVTVYQDWRELLRREAGNLDSVNVSTPDHMHAPIAMAAMSMGLPVYLQKPMALTVRETRLLADTARQRNLVTQMGIQISSHQTQLAAEAMVRAGAIGKVREVHTFCDKTWGDPDPIPAGSDPIPETLDWDGWIGIGEKRPYKADVYHPGQWRKRMGFGTGTLGDMGCHIFSTPMRSLGLHIPTQITSHGPAGVHGNWPIQSRIHYVFPGTELTAATTVDFWWYDGEEPVPQAVVDLAGGKRPPSGCIWIGTEGALLLPHIGEPTLHPADKFAARSMPDVPTRDHWHEFLDAVLQGPGTKTSAGFDYSQLVTEVVLLGTIASHYPSTVLAYDPATMRFTGHREANRWFTRKYRSQYLMTKM
jgi:predicted dehydrogenase